MPKKWSYRQLLHLERVQRCRANHHLREEIQLNWVAGLLQEHPHLVVDTGRQRLSSSRKRNYFVQGVGKEKEMTKQKQ